MPPKRFSIYGITKDEFKKTKLRIGSKPYLLDLDNEERIDINYPNDFKYTRIVEIKHVTKQKSNYTVISKEYPTNKGDPYYPLSDKKNLKLFNKYKKLITKEKRKHIYFEGRLAKYKYFNTTYLYIRYKFIK